jgi:hypothetical protein
VRKTGVLPCGPDPAVKHEAAEAQEKIGHAHEQIDAGVIRLGFLERVVAFLQTGGCLNGFPSERASLGPLRSKQKQENRQNRASQEKWFHPYDLWLSFIL